ncbi:hypothetical protein C8R46DRAFT_1189404 [Mycena filopes]|nr:hypothetical protein C8R46DRAFT_1189404 [Mycena filopes]
MRPASCPFLILSLYLPHSTLAKLVTTILDDAFSGDSQSSISYSPANVWVVGSTTNHGRVSPDPSLAFDSTWHDATDDTTPDHAGTTPIFMEVTFQGTGIDIRCIIANNKNDPTGTGIPPFTGTKSDYSFFIDGVAQNRDYNHEAGTTGDVFLYNTSVFSTTGLSAASHTLKLLLNGGPQVDGSVLLLFDSAIVTADDGSGTGGADPPPSGPTSTPTTTVPPSTTEAKVISSASGSSSPAAPTSSRSSTAGSVVSGSASPSSLLSGSAPPAHGTPQSGSAPSSPTGRSSAVPFPPVAHKSNIGPIIGAVVGAILVLLLLLLCLWARRRRSRRRARLPTVSPFTAASASGTAPSSIRPRFNLRSLLSTRKRPSPSASRPSASRTESHPLSASQKGPPSAPVSSSAPAPSLTTNSATTEAVLRLQAEVDQLRAQQGQQTSRTSLLEPPPLYSP